MTIKRNTTVRDRHRKVILSASTICHLCGHDGADAVDHVIPLAKGGTDTLDNKAPAHHQPCPSCGIQCNRVKSDRLIAPVMRRSSSLAR